MEEKEEAEEEKEKEETEEEEKNSFCSLSRVTWGSPSIWSEMPLSDSFSPTENDVGPV